MCPRGRPCSPCNPDLSEGQGLIIQATVQPRQLRLRELGPRGARVSLQNPLWPHASPTSKMNCFLPWGHPSSSLPEQAEPEQQRSHLIFSGTAAPPVPNFSCLLRTSRGGLATELTKAIFACRPVDKWRLIPAFLS